MVFASTSSVRTTVLEQNHLCNEAAATAARLEPLRQSNRNEVLSFYFILSRNHYLFGKYSGSDCLRINMGSFQFKGRFRFKYVFDTVVE